MCILRVSSQSTGLIVADFFVHALVPSPELCLEDIVASTKGKRKKGGTKEGGNPTSPLHYPGSATPSAEGKIRSGGLTPATSGARERVEMVCHPGILRDPKSQAREVNSEVAASPLPSEGPKRGRKWYVTPAFAGVPNAKCGK